MSVSRDLARAREQNHLSRAQVAKRTQLNVQSIAAIEEGDVDRLPDMLYLRGAVSAFAAAVGLDPDVTSDRYMSQLNHHSALEEFASEESPELEAIGATAADARNGSHPGAPDEFPVEISPPVDIPPPAIVVGPKSAFQNASARVAPDGAAPLPPQRASVRVGDPGLGAQATPVTSAWRRAPSGAVRRQDPRPQHFETGPDSPVYQQGPVSKRRTSVALWLQVAWARPASLTYATLAVVTLITVTTGLWFLITARGRGNDVALHAPGLPQAITVDVWQFRQTVTPESDAGKPGELTGGWMLTSNVERSSRNAFNDLTLGFRLQLEQTGNRIRGQGHKWTENGRRVAAGARTPITVEGTIDNGRLVLTFTERGTRRTSRGTFDLQRAGDGSLHGRFSTDAAQSSGRVRAVRLSS